jgi:hypothetical protein
MLILLGSGGAAQRSDQTAYSLLAADFPDDSYRAAGYEKGAYQEKLVAEANKWKSHETEDYEDDTKPVFEAHKPPFFRHDATA